MSAPRFVVYCTSKITRSSSCRRRSHTETPAAPLIHPKPLHPPEPVPLAVARWERQKKDWVVNMAILALYTDIPLSAPANNPALARVRLSPVAGGCLRWQKLMDLIAC